MIRLVVDANIVLSALINSRKIKNILIDEKNIGIYAPAYVYFEIVNHYNKVLKYTSLSENEILFILIKIIPKRIHICGEHTYYDKIGEAFQIAKEFDEKDTPFIALALKLNMPIWTGDRQMIVHGLRAGGYLALDTPAVEGVLSGKNLEEIKEELKKKISINSGIFKSKS